MALHRIFFLAVAGFLAFSAAAANASVFFEVPPTPEKNLPLAFDFQTKRLSNRKIQVTVVVSGNANASWHYDEIPKNSGTWLVRVRIADTPEGHEQGLKRTRVLPSKNRGKLVKCVFSVSQQELDDPDVCFCFVILSENQRDYPYDNDYYYARLRNFLKP
jgi:hypothetical protein